MLRDTDATRRAQAAYGLGRLEEEAAPASTELAKALNDENLRVRIEATVALGRIGPVAAHTAPNLTSLLAADSDAALRRQAAMALGRIESETALPALENARNTDPAPIVRQAAADAIKRIRKQD